MRVPPTTEPRPRRRFRFRFRGWMIGGVVALVVLLFSLRGLAGFYTDFLWFDSLGQGGTWTALLTNKIAPALVFTVAFFVLMLVNLIVADRLAPKYRSMGPEDEFVARYQTATRRFTGRIRIGIAVFFALIAGIGVSSQWQQWVLFTNSVEVGITDPQFHKDIGFYLFRLPFLEFIADWLFAGLLIVLVVTAVAHYLNGGIRFQSPFQRVTPQVKAHLSVILAAMALVKTAQYYLGRFELNFSSRGVVEGASYTEVKAQLPALNLLIVISIFAAGLFLWNIQRRGWVLPVLAVGLWGFVSIVVGTVIPAAVQQFRVGPDEFNKEAPYIARNIRATRDAFDLSGIAAESYKYTTFDTVSDASAVIDANEGTIDNARLWDPGIMQQTYQAVQSLQTYYQIGDVDVDRYLVNNETRQVLIAARGLNAADLPSQSFVNRQIVYTHGYGIVASPSNDAEPNGSPEYYLSNIPVEVDPVGPQITSQASQLYFSEGLGGYVFTGAESPEFNIQREGRRDSFTRYRGDDGVDMSNIVRKAAFALRFGDINPLISSQIKPDTKIHLYRDIRARAQKLAPFLRFDADPYPVVLGDRTLWVLDGYTVSDMYPYSQATSGEGGLAEDVNYVRNSVKVTVDAYEGTTKFYVFDPDDPIIRAWSKAFPDLFTAKSQIPEELEAHLRYPEDLFKIQSNMYGSYHVGEPRRFYDGSSKWLISPDPGSGQVNAISVVDGTGVTDTTTQPQAASSTGKRIDPYYLYLKLPDETKEQFLTMVPFVPVSANNSQNRLVSFLTASSDPGSYGELRSFQMPQGETVLGPVQVDNEIARSPAISRTLTLLNQQGSKVLQGSLQLIPVGDGLIYVRPYYAQSNRAGSFPLFQFVAIYSQGMGNAVCAQTVNEGLDVLFGGGQVAAQCEISGDAVGDGGADPGTGDAPGTTTTTLPSGTTTTLPGNPSVTQLLTAAAEKFDQANAALAASDLGRYQTLVKEAEALLRQAQAKQ